VRASGEITWEHTVKQAESVPPSAVGSVLDSMPESVRENVLRVYLGASYEDT
jgi:hypothetical protein